MSFRFVFIFSLLSFLNPIAVMAAENESAKCWKFVEASKAKNFHAPQAPATRSAVSATTGKTKTSVGSN